MELPALPVLVQRVLQALAVSAQQVQQGQQVPELQAQPELAPQALQVLLACKALPVLVLPAQRGCKAPLVLTERQAQRVLALTALQVQLEQPAPLVSGQPACRVPLELLAQPAPLELRASLEPLEPRDHKDFLLASLTTNQKQRQQVAIQAMDLFCGIMQHKLMPHNYWLAT